MLHRHIRYSCVYTSCMSPALSGSSVLQLVKLCDALKIRNRIIIDLYPRLPHILQQIQLFCGYYHMAWRQSPFGYGHSRESVRHETLIGGFFSHFVLQFSYFCFRTSVSVLQFQHFHLPHQTHHQKVSKSKKEPHWGEPERAPCQRDCIAHVCVYLCLFGP